MDYSKVLWSTTRETDKVFTIWRTTLTIAAGNTSSPSDYPVYGNVIGTSPTGPVGGKANTLQVKYFCWYKYNGTWQPASPIVGAAEINGIGVVFDMYGVYAFSNSTSGSPRSVDVVAMFMPTSKFKYNYSNGIEYTAITGPVAIGSNSTMPKIKWSSLERQATIAGQTGLVFNADGSPRRIATIPHGMTTRPTTVFSTCALGKAPVNIHFGSPSPQFITIWKDTTNIYVEYTGTTNDGEFIVQVWWYNE